MLVVLKLVKARAGRRQEDSIAWHGQVVGPPYGYFQVAGANDFNSSVEVCGDFVGGSSNQEDFANPVLEQWAERRVGRALVLPSENQMNSFVKGGQRLGGRIDTGGLGVVIELDAMNLTNKFEPVFDANEFAHRIAHRIKIRAHHAGRRRGR